MNQEADAMPRKLRIVRPVRKKRRPIRMRKPTPAAKRRRR